MGRRTLVSERRKPTGSRTQRSRKLQRQGRAGRRRLLRAAPERMVELPRQGPAGLRPPATPGRQPRGLETRRRIQQHRLSRTQIRRRHPRRRRTGPQQIRPAHRRPLAETRQSRPMEDIPAARRIHKQPHRHARPDRIRPIKTTMGPRASGRDVRVLRHARIPRLRLPDTRDRQPRRQLPQRPMRLQRRPIMGRTTHRRLRSGSALQAIQVMRRHHIRPHHAGQVQGIPLDPLGRGEDQSPRIQEMETRPRTRRDAMARPHMAQHRHPTTDHVPQRRAETRDRNRATTRDPHGKPTQKTRSDTSIPNRLHHSQKPANRRRGTQGALGLGRWNRNQDTRQGRKKNNHRTLSVKRVEKTGLHATHHRQHRKRMHVRRTTHRDHQNDPPIQKRKRIHP